MKIVNSLRHNDQLAKVFWVFRRLYIRYILGLKYVDKTFFIGGKSSISKDLRAEAYSYIGRNCLLYPKVSIGRYTMLAQNVQIIGADHKFNVIGVPAIFTGREELKETKIGRDVWIGANSIVMTGITIGDGSIIAAGSVVTKDIPPFVIVGGVPAKVIKKRFQSEKEEQKHLEMLNGKCLKYIRNKPIS